MKINLFGLFGVNALSGWGYMIARMAVSKASA